VLRAFAQWNPLSAVVGALRDLFGNGPVPTTGPWPVTHPVPAAGGPSLPLVRRPLILGRLATVAS
jgi:hypothetical protein